ncbi:MAG TPA: 8-amino-7-oxononanoate synthase [Kiritimatiellia bacterium]|nr:8-amino-7-oxononanoate synthase [Kiritimatiellia bacterium]HRZ11925.1 8-amino-7-oxononanoate synthase [Kiritimatiellia bacterium]HSA17269.1 8-amino-7-oxononanoate synthase [Kiritimatiellia bacterium]
MQGENWLEDGLAELRAGDLERRLTAFPATGGRITVGGRTLLNLSSNDYLGLACHPRVVEAAVKALHEFGAGATASRLITGTLPLHEELEQRLAALKGYPAALVFGSGYLANAGTIPALVGPDDLVLADRLAHASLLDAAVLSRARLLRFRHNDALHLDELLSAHSARRRLVLTESVFSMDGDLAPLPDLAAVAARHEALMLVDEAHATGVFGPGGAGLISEHGLADRVAVSMGTLSKALGSYGGFVACAENLRAWLVNKARAFIYTTAPPPAVLGAALGALMVLSKRPEMGQELLARAAGFRDTLKAAGLDTLNSASQIVPLMVGDNAKALALSRRLKDDGILAVAIRPPTVPPGTARLRFSISLAHQPADLAQAAQTIIAAACAENVA